MRQSLLTVALLVLAWLAWVLRDLLTLLGFAALLAYALDPIVRWVERRRLPGHRTIPRSVAAALVILVLVLALETALVEAMPRLAQQFGSFAMGAPGTVARLEQQARAFLASHGWASVVGSADDASGTAASVLATLRNGLVSRLGGLLGGLGQLATVVLLPLFSFYLLADRDGASAGLLAKVPPGQRIVAVRIRDALDGALRSYVRGQALVCLAMGTTMSVVLQLLGFPVALMLGFVVGLGEIIPILGFWLAASAIALEGYSKSPGLAVAGVVAYIVVNNLMETFVSPRLLGRQMKLHPLIVNVSVIGGGMLLGPAGAILALPVAASVKALLDEFEAGIGEPELPARGATTTSS